MNLPTTYGGRACSLQVRNNVIAPYLIFSDTIFWQGWNFKPHNVEVGDMIGIRATYFLFVSVCLEWRDIALKFSVLLHYPFAFCGSKLSLGLLLSLPFSISILPAFPVPYLGYLNKTQAQFPSFLVVLSSPCFRVSLHLFCGNC